jgi:hypothetical protein
MSIIRENSPYAEDSCSSDTEPSNKLTKNQLTKQALLDPSLPALVNREFAGIHTASGDNKLRYKLKSLYFSLQKKLDNRNPVVFDRCCLNFTTKAKQTLNDHPLEHQIPLRTLFKDNGIVDVNSFNGFVFKELEAFSLEYQFIPSINKRHKPEMNRRSDLFDHFGYPFL